MPTFVVDDVVPAAEPLPTTALGSPFPDALALGGHAFDRPNPLLELPASTSAAGRADRHHHGLDGAGRAFALRAGLVAVAQDQGGALRPVSGWRLEADGAVDHDDSRAALSRVLDGGGAIPAGRPLP